MKISSKKRLDSPRFVPEGAAFFEAEGIAVIADVHLGHEWARAASGEMMIEHSYRETAEKLERMIARMDIQTLIVAGDLVESRFPCARTARDVERLRDRLAERGVEFIPLRGNHDPRSFRTSRGETIDLIRETIEVAGWRIEHGHRSSLRKNLVHGHYHPIIRLEGVKATCFLVSDRRIVLPAFSSDAAGVDALSGALPKRILEENPRCLVATEDEVLDFGPIDSLIERSKRKRRS